MMSVSSFVWYEARTKRSVATTTTATTTTTNNKHRKWIIIYGPALLVTAASGLILADPIRHFLQDRGHWKAPMYISNCPVRAHQQPERTCNVNSDCGVHDCGNGRSYSMNPGEDCFTCWNDSMCSEGAETFACLSFYGWTVTIFCTYVGFAMFFAGVIWNSNLCKKISDQWKIIRDKTRRE